MPGEKLLLTPEETAERLSSGRTTVYALLAAGELESVKIGRSRRVVAASVGRYVERLTAGTPSDGGAVA